jgi:octaprenyl-diphosphate synthase
MSPSQSAETESDPRHAFSKVFALLAPHMTELDAFLRKQLAAFEPEIRSMADYCIDTSGKRIRPSLVFLSGWRGPQIVSPDLVKVAAVVELVHLATLVHDDIMDEAEVRRSRETAAKRYGPTSAVLLGDALFAHALNLATQFPTTEVCAAVSESTRRVCSGEIVQTLRRGTTNVSRSDYYRVIDLKTAELFRVSCHLGAKLSGASPEFVDAATRFGRHLGVAYQIYDDLADYFGDPTRIGKTLGTDLISGKLTLPLFTLLERVPAKDRQELLEEVIGKRVPQLDLRLQQMSNTGVFEEVSRAVFAEIDSAVRALAPWEEEAPSRLLLQLCGVLRDQVLSLKSAA